jgi:hypothetical protein
METIIPVLAAPISRMLSFALERLSYPHPVGWALVLVSIGAIGAIFRRRHL